MSINYPKSGPNSVPAYQLSGIPYVTSSASNEVTHDTVTQISFPYVTRFFEVENTGGNALRYGFTQSGVTGSITQNYIILDGITIGSTYELRCKDLFFMAENPGETTSFRVVAGLTIIDRKEFPALTGSVGGVAAFEGVG